MVDDYYVEHFVTQHDMLRELAVYNAKLDPIEQRKRLIVDISGDNEPKWLTEQKSQPIKARLLSISSGCSISLALFIFRKFRCMKSCTHAHVPALMTSTHTRI